MGMMSTEDAEFVTKLEAEVTELRVRLIKTSNYLESAADIILAELGDVDGDDALARSVLRKNCRVLGGKFKVYDNESQMYLIPGGFAVRYEDNEAAILFASKAEAKDALTVILAAENDPDEDEEELDRFRIVPVWPEK